MSGNLKLNTALGGSVALTPENTASNITVTVPATAGTMLTTATAGVPIDGPAFSAYQSSTQSIANATGTKILFQTESYDTNSNYDTSNSRFTPTVAGYYQINAAWTGVATAANLMTLYIYKNGAITLNGGNFFIGAASNIGSSMSGLIYCNGSTDYIEIYGFESGTAPMTTVAAANGTYFQGCLVRSAT